MSTLPPGLRYGSRLPGSQALTRETEETRALPRKASLSH